jgi:hypothetical protein
MIQMLLVLFLAGGPALAQDAGYKVSGRVTGLLTTQGARVVLVGGTLGPGVEAPIDSDGAFTFSGIAAGSYTARLSLSGIQTGKSITVENADLTGVTIAFPRRFAVAWHTIVEGDTALSNPPYLVLQSKVKGSLTAFSSGGVGPAILTLAAGDHNIALQAVPSGYQLKSITYGTTDLQKEPLRIDGPVLWEIIVRLARVAPSR